MPKRTLRAGDIVKHIPTDETWMLACDELDNARVIPAGYPASLARSTDCQLLKSASDDERIKILQLAAKSIGDSGYSYRAVIAQRQLDRERKTP